MSRNVTIHGEMKELELQPTVENNDLAKLTLLNSFQDRDSESFSSVSDRKTPYYRKIKHYTKSKEQYWAERKRRKKVWLLCSKGYTYKQIAKKLGVSEKTVQRDINKVRRYYIGRINKAERIIQEERIAGWDKMLEGLTLRQRFKLTTQLLCTTMDKRREREYNRHLLKIILDMDNLKHGVFPTLKVWPDQDHLKVTYPFHVRFVLRVDARARLPEGEQVWKRM